MKKILILGGTYFQLPAIKYAKLQGYYVITCDYLPNNPGHRFADEYHNVSTTDKEAVCALAAQLKVDGILCFASDPAAATAAYVSDKLGLPGNSLAKIRILGEKNLWRNFLLQNGFNVPKAEAYSTFTKCNIDDWNYPVMVKPIDSSGSKGVTKVVKKEDMRSAFDYAYTYSRKKLIIVEEFIEKVGTQIGGDGFYGENKLSFVCFGDQVVDESINPFVPCGMKFPSYIDEKLAQRIFKEIERALSIIGVKNLSFNLEVMIDNKGKIYLMEIGPRNGGNSIPEVIYHYTGMDLVALAVESALGNAVEVKNNNRNDDKAYAYYALHSKRKGKYRNFSLSSHFIGRVIDSYIFLDSGDSIDVFSGSNQTIGVLLLEFNSIKDMNFFFDDVKNQIIIKVD